MPRDEYDGMDYAQLQAALAEANKRHRAIKREFATNKKLIEEMESKLKRLNERQREINGGPWSRDAGEIQHIASEITRIELLIRDSSAPVVHWVDGDDVSSYYSGWVVDKVTEKRIFIRPKGGTACDTYNHDGTQVGRSYKPRRIDIARTFPLGLKVGKQDIVVELAE